MTLRDDELLRLKGDYRSDIILSHPLLNGINIIAAKNADSDGN